MAAKDTTPGAFTGFPDETFRFLREIAKHNDKAWLDAHRDLYETGYVAPARAFVAALGPELRSVSKTVSFDPKVNGSLFRIHRDVRFSNDKTPYKTHLDLWFWEGKRRGWEAPGLYIRMTPKTFMVGGGMHGLDKDALARYRDAVDSQKSGAALVKLVADLRERGYTIGGATRKKVPRGYEPDHPRAALLLHDSLFAGVDGPHPKEISSKKLVAFCVRHFASIAPLNRWLIANVTK